MKIAIIFVTFALSVIVKGNLFANAARGIEPIILSFGAAFAALANQPEEKVEGEYRDWIAGFFGNYLNKIDESEKER